MTIVEDTRAITGGVDTHAGLHAAAALDRIGGLLGVREFPATAAGYARLLAWLRGFGDVALVGVEGTGSYGAGLARHLAAAGVRVVEVDRADRQDRRRQAGIADALATITPALLEGRVPHLLAAALRPASTHMTSTNHPATRRRHSPARSEPVRTRAPRAPPLDRRRKESRKQT